MYADFATVKTLTTKKERISMLKGQESCHFAFRLVSVFSRYWHKTALYQTYATAIDVHAHEMASNPGSSVHSYKNNMD